jgi:4-amino-4-deoxy-L-arabinose transferase-like glycosyltransferase
MQAGVIESRSGIERAARRGLSIPRTAAPYALALFFGLWALRNVGANNIIDTDAARHAMNGVFVRDLIASGQFLHPIEYGKQFYSHLPALSMPYHPPLFPAIEAVFFAVFGVNVLAARLSVAVLCAITVFLFYRLVVDTCRSHAVAASSVIIFFSMKMTQMLASDTMLEVPSLAFTIAALYLLRNLDRGYLLRYAIGFAVLAGAAVWTKQHAVFLALVPFLYAILARRFRLLAAPALWLSSVLLGIEVLALSLLAIPFKGTGVDQVSPTNEIVEIFAHNFIYYADVFRSDIGVLGVGLFVAAFLWTLYLHRGSELNGKIYLYVSWAAAAFLLLLLIGPYDPRYLFYMYPPLIVLACVTTTRVSAALAPRLNSGYAPLAAAAVFAAAELTGPSYLTGPSQAAAALGGQQVKRVLYCGDTDGSFMFAVRSQDRALRTIVIAGDKLDETVFTSDHIEAFARRYGIDHIVIEKISRARPWDKLGAIPPPSMPVERRIELRSSNPRWNGELTIYRFLNPSPTPERTLSIPIPRIGSQVETKF